MGFTALRQIGVGLGMPADPDADPDAEIQLRFEDFAAAVDMLRLVDFPMERDAAEAWPHFRGWRVNYESLAYGLARHIDAVPAPWSGRRRWPAETIPVRRPANRAPKDAKPPFFLAKDVSSPGKGYAYEGKATSVVDDGRGTNVVDDGKGVSVVYDGQGTSVAGPVLGGEQAGDATPADFESDETECEEVDDVAERSD
jgi:hypothetical protein